MSGNKSKGWFKSAFDFEAPSSKTPTVKRSASVINNQRPSPKISPTEPSIKKTKLDRSTSLGQNATSTVPTVTDPGQIDWSIDLAPKSVADLAVHFKKIEEVQQWFRTYDRVKGTDPAAILLVSGPAGCGKSSTIKTVAGELGYEVSEWTTPVDVDLFYHNYDFEGGTREDVTFRESQREQFDSFLYKTSRYCSIFEGASDQKLLLVKDIPNVFLREPEVLKASLEAYQETGASPLVFIATDTSSKKLDIVYNLFPPGVLQDFRIHHIAFNSVSTTLMKKALKRITSLMVGPEMTRHYRVPSQDLIDSIILSSQGDLRSATLNVHFASLKNAPRLETEAVSGGSGTVLNTSGMRSTKGRKKETKLKSVGGDGSITLMHALGRVFNPKFEDSNKFHHSPEDLSDAFVSQPGAMISLIHSNYVTRFTDIEDIVGAADVLSLADVIMSDGFREDQLTGHGLNLIVRGMMVHNRKTASGWQQIRKKKTFDKPSVSNHEQQLKKFGLEASSISAGLLVTDYKKYLDIIKGTSKV
ncbi:cell cycle checkpoint protein RAD17 [Aedes aegypti]|uniref:Cell cycle checkpoint protein rad17 n=1 Tax=Aedes aegypti TaxID=7159 RepID=A0A6I8U5E5_AEDAE|nr:cell cycle checkpoint protein RAD17 [Aedes aegypti]